MKQAIILSAGEGRRLGLNKPKGLVKVAGKEILLRSMILLSRLGIVEFVLVANVKYRKHFENFLSGSNFNLRFVWNEYPERENGYSLHLAREYAHDRFVLIMSDHVYSFEFLKKAIHGDGIVVDREGRYIDIHEATKVICRKGYVEDIGKKLEMYDYYDTGFFVLRKDIFEHTSKLESEKQTFTLSEVVKRAKLPCYEVSGEFWMDVDTPEDVRRATNYIVEHSVKSKGDGLISRYLNRRISILITKKVVNILTPNQATFLSFVLGIFSALLVPLSLPLAGILYQISSILDGVDGEIARASLSGSKFGGYLDSILDRVVDFAYLFACAMFHATHQSLPWILLAIFGSVMVSYSTERYKASFFRDAHEDVEALNYIPGKRDERVFIIMLLSILQMVDTMFVVIAIVSMFRFLATVLAITHRRYAF